MPQCLRLGARGFGDRLPSLLDLVKFASELLEIFWLQFGDGT
jgi:hypothetical protein